MLISLQAMCHISVSIINLSDNTETDLIEGQVFSFTTEEGNNENKYAIKFAQKNSVGIEDVANNIVESINLVPNPVKDAATLTYTIKDNAHAIFVLYNSEGQELISKQLIGKGKQDISLNSYPAGTYFYRVYENERILKTDKLVIVR